MVKIVTHHKNPDRAAELFIEEGVVAIGWSDVGDLSGRNRDEIKESIKNVYKKLEYTEQEAASAAGALLRFRDEISKGDFVFAYARHNRVAVIGEVIGDYEFNQKNKVGDPDGEIDYANQRRVKWRAWPRNFDRSYLPDEVAQKVALPGAIHVFEYDFEKLMKSLNAIPKEEMREKILEVESEDEIKEYLRKRPRDLEEGLEIVQSEYETSAGPMDFLAKDKDGKPVVIEVKVKAGDSAVGQILGYIRAYEEEKNIENVRGIIVAEKFEDRCRKATKGLNLNLYECKLKFDFAKIN